MYEIGDLDDFFWAHTIWYALCEQDEILQLALLYVATPNQPVLICLSNATDDVSRLLQPLTPLLPKRFYAHFNVDSAHLLSDSYSHESHGIHFKLALRQKELLADIDTERVEGLTHADLAEIYTLYAESYPGNCFDPQMLETGHYYGIRSHGKLISIAGLHVYSSTYKVATLGNVATHPDFRGQGHSTAVCARLCQELLQSVEHIGLNVKADNVAALNCYKRLGFEQVASYEECAFALI